MKWLISFKYHAVFYKTNSTNSMVGPTMAVTLSDDHPAKFVVKMQRDFEEARNGTGERRGDMLEGIYYAVEVPDGLLTEEEAEELY